MRGNAHVRFGGRAGETGRRRRRHRASVRPYNALRAGGTGRVLGFTVKAASTLGTFLRSFRWGHVRQLDRGQPGAARRGPGRRVRVPATGP